MDVDVVHAIFFCRLDEQKVKDKTVEITKLDIALNNCLVRAKTLG